MMFSAGAQNLQFRHCSALPQLANPGSATRALVVSAGCNAGPFRSVLRGGGLLGTPALRPRHGFLAHCASPMCIRRRV